MKKNYILIFKLVLFFNISFFSAATCAQNNTTSGGYYATGSNGSVSFSVGQVFCSVNTGLNGIINQGVQQPFEITIITGISNPTVSLNISGYPNPNQGSFYLNIEETDYYRYNYQLLDGSGKILLENKVAAHRNVLYFDGLSTGYYILSIFRANRLIKSYKLLKQN